MFLDKIDSVDLKLFYFFPQFFLHDFLIVYQS